MGTDKTLRELVSDLKNDLVEICKDVSDVKSALIGDEYRKGLIQKIDNHSKRIDKLEKFKWVLIGAIGVINVLVIVVVKYI